MDLRRLEAFCKVYELKSFSKAGRELYLSQPTISAHISTLEEELGVQLFDRLGRSIMSTQAGEVLYRNAKDIYELIGKAHSEINLLRDKVVGDLDIGGSTIPSHYLLPGILYDYCKRFPDVRVHMSVGDTSEILQKIRSGDLILGIVGATSDSPNVEFIPIMRDELVIVAPPVLVKNYEGIVDIQQLAELPWVMREGGSGTRKALEQGLAELGTNVRDLNVTVWVESTQAVVQCVKAGLGISVTSRLAAQSLIDSGELVHISDLPLNLERSFYLAHLKGREFFPAVRYFIEHVKSNSFDFK
ncbi:DNA-binding transcriptional regulator, LysR family [Maridesulfovibrio ferrireducens]|uniref:DNA-binding transcriptional regulator, LysR family n=1 Tax=Maridesulfovibrio ferrireducens TaxID=246191 RepID=A0A1G9F5I7_9BACT|nr:selenium metabolism-associated LysR family transcriptional regulator [Maridesulfovibrio ferrireducens]SDK83600.1 DNA-binding transcriptional regulator, LysR family [Maridesulfovibrio ferrireducens]